MCEPQSILVIGANRGIGFELANRLLSHGHIVYGTYRASSKDDSSVSQLRTTKISLLELDVTDEDLIRLAAREFDQQSLDTLINVAGIYSNWDDKPFTELSPEDLVWHFKVNVVGPFLTSKYFLPALSRSKSGRIITCSSDMGSIADNIPGGNACYRISKSGVNQLTKTMALDLKKVAPDVLTLAVHPGFVATRMTGYHGEDDMDECMNGFVSIVERFGQKGDDLENGSYVRWNGERMNY